MATQDSTTTVRYLDIPTVADYPKTVGYQAGTDGSIWSSQKTWGTRFENGVAYKQLNGCINQDGYIVITLTLSGFRFHFLVHRLILLTFIGPCPEGLEACHDNGIPDDNRLENLRYDTHRSNIHDKFKHGTVHRGEQIVQSKLTEIEVVRIKRLSELGVPGSVLAEAFGVQRPQICRILKGERWSHI